MDAAARARARLARRGDDVGAEARNHMTHRKHLIVNADDLGLSDGVNRGIFCAHENGIVTSASLMVRQPAAKEATRSARRFPDLGIGLHFDLGELYRDGEAW